MVENIQQVFSVYKCPVVLCCRSQYLRDNRVKSRCHITGHIPRMCTVKKSKMSDISEMKLKQQIVLDSCIRGECSMNF
jgi:hypothetical protein